MADVYGERVGQGLADEDWLRDAGQRRLDRAHEGRGDPLPPSRAPGVVDHGLRAFCLTNANLRGTEMAARFVARLPEILRAAREPGPFIAGVYADGIRRLWPPSN